MNQFDFTFGMMRKDIPVVSLTSGGLSFNRISIAALGSPAYVAIGLDKEHKRLAIKAADSGGSCPCYRFVTNENNTKWVLVTSIRIRNEILKLLNIQLRRSGIKFPAVVDPDSNFLIADLNHPVF